MRGAYRERTGAPPTAVLFWQVAKTPSALLEALTDAVLDTARRELRQG